MGNIVRKVVQMRIQKTIIADSATLSISPFCGGSMLVNMCGVSLESLLDGIRPIDMVRVVGSATMRKAVNDYVRQRKNINHMDKKEN
jgi:hypothetical protein